MMKSYYPMIFLFSLGQPKIIERLRAYFYTYNFYQVELIIFIRLEITKIIKFCVEPKEQKGEG